MSFAYGATVHFAVGDVADREFGRRFINDALERFGRVDVLVNNASLLGPSPLPPLQSFPLDALQQIFAANVLGPLFLAQLVLPRMIAVGRGLIVNISSDAAVGGYPGWGGYGASKAALDLITHTLANELAGTGVGAVAIDPGDMRTEMHQAAFPGEDISDRPLPEEVAPAIFQIIEKELTGARKQRRDANSGSLGEAQELLRSSPALAVSSPGGGAVVKTEALAFDLPQAVYAQVPPEARGLERDQVRLLVSSWRDGTHCHDSFLGLAKYLKPGDLLVVNNSRTIPASLSARIGRFPVRLHLSTDLNDGRWIVEVREASGAPWEEDLPFGTAIEVVGAPLQATVLEKYRDFARLWLVEVAGDPLAAAFQVGSPIRYPYVAGEWPLRFYQTLFAKVDGSAEMPSAGRPFTPRGPPILKAKRRGNCRSYLAHRRIQPRARPSQRGGTRRRIMVFYS